MASLTGALKGLPGYATISGFMEKAGKVWDKIKGFFGRVAKAFKSFFESIGNAVEEVLDGFASRGPRLPAQADPEDRRAERVGESSSRSSPPPPAPRSRSSSLFETDPPRNAGEFFPGVSS